MNPILFSENSTSFTTNGVGRLSDAVECVVVEERNGIYELEMTYPMDGAHYSDIGIRSIIVAKPSANGNIQPFRVYKITKPINGKVKVYAQHISYDLSKNTTMPFSVSASSTACNTTLQGLKSNAVESCPFTFWTDVNTVASYAQKVPASIKQRMGGIEGSVIDQFGGEYEYDVYTVKLWKDRGARRDITLRYGKNIIDLEQEENVANTVTGVVPFWTDTDNAVTVTLPEKAVYSSHASQYSTALTVPLDLSDQWDEQPTQASLRAAATVYVNKDDFGVPKVSTKVNFINLADTEEYKDILPLQNVNLCDTIVVQFEKLGINTTAKIVKTEYNVLAERYNSIEVGSLRSNLAATITDIERSGVQEIEATGKRVFADANTQAQDLVNTATGWITAADGYVIARKDTDGTWKELIFADHKDPSDWVNVLRVNQNGIGFSSNGGQTYTQAWTLDGKLTIGGTNVPSITCYDSGGNIIFQASRSGLIWDAANTTLDAQGKLTATDATLTGSLETSGTYEDTSTTPYTEHTRKTIMNDGELAWYNDSARVAGITPNFGKLTIDSTGDLKADAGNDVKVNASNEIQLTATDDVIITANQDVRINSKSDLTLSNGVSASVYSNLNMYNNGDLRLAARGGSIQFLEYNGNNVGTEIDMNTNNIRINPGGTLKIRNNGTDYTGHTGTVIEDISTGSITFVESASLSITPAGSWVRGMLWDVVMNGNGTLSSWVHGDVYILDTVNYSFSAPQTTISGMYAGHSWKNTKNGIVVQ